MAEEKSKEEALDVNKVTFVSGTELFSGELIKIVHPLPMDLEEKPKTLFLGRNTEGKFLHYGSVGWLPE